MPAKTRKSLMRAVLAPVAALAVGAAAPAASLAQPVNPCAPAATPRNPCAPAATPAPAPKAEASADLPKGPYDTTTNHPQAVYGNKMPNIVENYTRATPYIGAGGAIDPAGMDILAGLGFKTIVNLKTADEGAETERVTVERAGMTYINIAVSTEAPDADQVAAFAAVAENASLYPILLHCEGANRAGAMWALYRASKGVPAAVAVEEGRAVGLQTNREGAVRKQLGLPPL